jgi:ABC-type ATPase with predicted acetyltransferase domain
VTVGEDITCPAAIARNGTIRIRSERAAQVARWFGLDRRSARSGVAGAKATSDGRVPVSALETAPAPTPALALALRAGTITLIAGPSGAGKSTLLRAARDAHANRRWIDLATIAAPAPGDAPIVDCFGDLTLRDVLALLARVGLGEAWTYLRTPAELSEGQRWRFRLAMALHAASRAPRRAPERHGDARQAEDDRPIIACDEFAAVLDRVTAIVVAHRLRRAIDALPHAAAVVATSHEDIEPALAAEVIVRCDFGRVAEEETCEHEST